jgi:hypothetical protein
MMQDNQLETIDLNEMAMVTGGGFWGSAAKFVRRNWNGIVSAADLAYQVGRDIIRGDKKE